MRWLAVVLLVTTGQVFAQESARQWLDDMSSALQTLDYDGTFVYLHDNKLETMRIIHQLAEGGVKERLVSLTGNRTILHLPPTALTATPVPVLPARHQPAPKSVHAIYLSWLQTRFLNQVMASI